MKESCQSFMVVLYLNGFLYYVILLSKATKTYDWEV